MPPLFPLLAALALGVLAGVMWSDRVAAREQRRHAEAIRKALR